MIRSPDTFLATSLPDRFTWIRLSFNYETSKKRIDSIAEILHSIALWGKFQNILLIMKRQFRETIMARVRSEGHLSWDDRRPRNRGVFVVWPNDTESYQCDREWWREFEVSRSWDLLVHENCSPFLSTGFLSRGMPANMGRTSESLLSKSRFVARMTIVSFSSQHGERGINLAKRKEKRKKRSINSRFLLFLVQKFINKYLEEDYYISLFEPTSFRGIFILLFSPLMIRENYYIDEILWNIHNVRKIMECGINAMLNIF